MSIGRALALLGAGVGGYARGVEAKRQADNEQADAEWRKEQRDRQRIQWQRDDEQYAKDKALEGQLEADAKPVTAQPELGPDQAGPQAWRAGSGPWTGNEAVAQDQAGEQSSMVNVMRRQAATLQAAGKADAADARLKRAGELEKEGVLDALRGIRGAMPAPESITGTKAGFVSFAIPEEVRKNFNARGKIKIPEGAAAQAYMRTLDDGTTIPDFRIVSGDGAKTFMESGATTEGAIGMTLAERTKQAQADRKFKLDREDKLADNRRQEERDRANADYQRRVAAAAEMTARAHLASAGAKGGSAPDAPIETAESTFDRKLASTTARDQVLAVNKANVENGKPPMTAAETARAIDDIVNEQWKIHSDRFTARTIQRNLSMATDPAAYAAEWEKAKRVMPEPTLLALGFKPPGYRPPAGPPKSAAGKAMARAENIPGSVVRDAAGNYVAAPETAPAAQGPRMAPAVAAQPAVSEADQIREALARDDRIKSSWSSGIGAAILKERAAPLGLAERRALEERLKQLATAR